MVAARLRLAPTPVPPPAFRGGAKNRKKEVGRAPTPFFPEASHCAALRNQLESKEAELLQVKLQLIESRITELQQRGADKELRLRTAEATRTRLETLAFGGGAISLFNILKSIMR